MALLLFVGVRQNAEPENDVFVPIGVCSSVASLSVNNGLRANRNTKGQLSQGSRPILDKFAVTRPSDSREEETESRAFDGETRSGEAGASTSAGTSRWHHISADDDLPPSD